MSTTFVSPDASTPSEPGFIYHATNVYHLYDIAQDGFLKPHKPWFGTEQSTWPDGSTESRSYWSTQANVVYAFAPEERPSVIIRTPWTKIFRRETTGDVYTTKKIPVNALEVLTESGWIPVTIATGVAEDALKRRLMR